MSVRECDFIVGTNLLLVLLGGGFTSVHHHFLGQYTFFGRIQSRLPCNTQFGYFTTRHTGTHVGHFAAHRTVVELIDFEASIK